ncbi:MAG: aldo/keto reductase [Methanobrevibacter sp.]|uniref:aldo/keto reductase n=1 Tax=Methanobrevibacter sp. TaxID=66852 RepID=UPI001B1EE0C4|nr:aldo/keto reductase [Methanobrevibacter sp.]MBO5152201.1 aldo/keto reductase [Methanobrevibacter sp.]
MKKLAFGMMRLPKLDENDDSTVDFEQVNKMADLFLEKDFIYFDTAYPYHMGNSEVAFRKAVVERYPRDSYVVADKLPLFIITSEDQLEPIFSEQLERTGLDYFDYYLLHNVSGFSEAGFLDVDSFAFANKKKEEGKIKHLGLSTHANAEYLDNILTLHPEMEFVLLQINYLDWENDGVESRKCWEVACKHNKPVLVMEPLKGGFLADVPPEAEKLMKDYNPDASVVSWALRFVASLDNVCMVLTGASSYDQLEQNIEDFENFTPLNDEEYEILDKVREIINSNISVECTKCKYCLDACPEEINIPKLFDLYNNEKIQDLGDWTAVGNAYVNYSKLPGVGLASDCIECGMCVEECPQHIDIPEVMKDVAKTFETDYYGFTD